MSKHPTLVAEIEQFFYQYAPQALHKKVLLDIVRTWEEAYQQRIAELENQSLMKAHNSMIDEGAPIQLECTCGHCYQCQRQARDRRQTRPWPDEDDENYGNRYGND